MESRVETITVTPRTLSTEGMVDNVKGMLQRANRKVVERAKAADHVVRSHPYQTIGLAFGLGLLVGILVRRKH